MFLINQFVQQESSKLKLKQTDKNSQAFKSIINETENEFEGYSNVTENYFCFKGIINKDNFDIIMKKYTDLLSCDQEGKTMRQKQCDMEKLLDRAWNTRNFGKEQIILQF